MNVGFTETFEKSAKLQHIESPAYSLNSFGLSRSSYDRNRFTSPYSDLTSSDEVISEPTWQPAAISRLKQVINKNRIYRACMLFIWPQLIDHTVKAKYIPIYC